MITLPSNIEISHNQWQIIIDGDIISQGNCQTGGGKISIHSNAQSKGDWMTTGGENIVDGNIKTAGEWKTCGGNITMIY